MKSSKKAAFTLIELMVVVVIIGILAALGGPMYNQYIAKSKIAEAYATIGNIKNSEIIFFNDTTNNVSNNQFFYLGINPNVRLAPVMTADSTWSNFPNSPLNVGSKVHFQYSVYAGKTDASGTEISDSNPGNATNPADLSTIDDEESFATKHADNPTMVCGNEFTAANLGVTAIPNYDWLLIGAVGDLNSTPETKCTTITMVVEASPANGRVPTARGMIIFNQGN